LGYEPEEIIGKHFSMILHPDNVKSFSRSVVLQKYANKVTGNEKSPNFFDERRTKDRVTRNLEIRLMPKSNGGGESNTTGIEDPITSFCEVTATGDYDTNVSINDKKLCGTLGIIRNISEKTKLQAEIIRAGQLALIGELAAGLAHEINNPINGIINYAQLIVDESDKDNRVHEFGEYIMEEGNRIADLANKLLFLSRSTTIKKEPVQIYELFSHSLKLSKVQLEADNIIVKVNIPKDLPALIANPQEIHQVFLNLIQNARYALNEKYPGKDKDKILEISCDKVSTDDHEYVRVIFYDRGIGIPENILSKIISPFFTTKPPTKGTGIGLSISQNIVNNHDGKMTLESIPGEFTKVVIDLPTTELTIKK
jgi:signal transduction histidine kinase